MYKQWYNNWSKTIKTCRKLYCFSRVSEGTLGSFGARWMVFPCREVIFSMVFFHPGTSRSSSKSLCSSFRSYVVQFWGFSVLHCHGVFPSRDQQQQQQKPLQQQEEQVAKIHSSSKRKKEPKASHHFLWVSEVTLGIFGVQFWASPSFRGMVFRPREVIFSMVFSHLGTGCKGSQNS